MKRAASLPGRSSLADTTRPRWRAAVARQWALAIHHRLLWGIIGCYLLLGFAASLLIPPWQSPDEPAHFEHAQLMWYGTDAELPEVQQPIIDTFYTYDFWQYRGFTEPDTRPASFSDMSRLIIRQVSKTPLYYSLAAVAASWTNDTILQLYSMRWLSVLLSALTIPFAYLLARELLPPERERAALAAAAFVALLPMYGYIGASVNPDNIGSPLAAATVWLGVRALRGKQPWRSALGVVALALITFTARRSGIALVPWALLICAALGLRWAWRRWPRPAVLAAVGLAVVLVAGVAAWPSNLAADWYPNGEQLQLSRSPAYTHSGSYSFALTAQSGGAPAAITHQITLNQVPSIREQSITVRAYARGGDQPSDGAITLLNQNGPFATLPVAAETDWEPLELQATVPATSTAVFVSLAGDGAPLYLDDIRVERADSAAPLVVSNAGAEDAFTWWQARFMPNTVVQYLTRIMQAARTGIYTSEPALALYPWQMGQLWNTFIGWFGWITFGPDMRLLQAIQLVWATLALGLVLRPRAAGLKVGERRRALLWILLLLVATIVTLFLEYTPSLSDRVFPQGRYLFPVIAPIGAILAAGLAAWVPPRIERFALAAWTAALVALNLWCWLGVIVPTFYI